MQLTLLRSVNATGSGCGTVVHYSQNLTILPGVEFLLRSRVGPGTTNQKK